MNKRISMFLKRNYYLLNIMTLVLLLAGCTNYDDPNAVAIKYVESVYNNEADEFKKLIEKKDFKSTKDYQWFIEGKSTGRQVSGLARGSVNSIEITDTSLKQNRAFIKIKVEFGNKSSKNLSISLHKDDDRWYVDPMTWATW